MAERVDFTRMLARIQAKQQEAGMLPDTNTAKSYKCDLCRDEEYVEVEKDGVVYMRPCECRGRNQIINRLKRSGLGETLVRCTFRTYTTREVWQAEAKDDAYAFVKDHKDKWLYVGGQVGSGKTHLCTAVVLELIKQGMDARYMLWRDEAVYLKSLITKDTEYQDAMRPYKTVDVLYIDDFLKTRKGLMPMAGDINLAIELINYRYINRNRLTTIISSELSMDELINIDEALGSRIMQASRNSTIIIQPERGRNYRLA